MTPASASLQLLTRSVEDYLKAVYHLTRDGQPATTSAVAHALEIAPPSVSGMVRRLAEQGLLAHVPYRGVELTEAGRRAALRVVRRHRIIEAYLVGRLGYTWDTVHDEAELLEHAVTDDLIERMARALGNPDSDPHGDPIPDASGRIAEEAYVALTDVPVGASARIRRVNTGEPSRLRYLGECGLTPGREVTVVAREPFGGPMTLERDGSRQQIGPELGRLLLCSQAQRPAGDRT
jgi:DtxR family Mn-dependent transcriptional regulator